MVQIVHKPSIAAAARIGISARYAVPVDIDLEDDFRGTSDLFRVSVADEGPRAVQFALLDDKWRVLATNSQWRKAAEMAEGEGLNQGQSYKRFWESQPTINMDSALRVLRGMRALEQGLASGFECKLRIGSHREKARISIAAVDAMGASFAIAVGPAHLSVPVNGRAAPPGVQPATEESLLARQTREDERRRIARDLHDSAAQHLTGLNLGLAHLRQISDDPDIRLIVDGLSKCLSCFHRDLRGLSYLLHPPVLEQFGLGGSVKALCDGLVRRANLDIALSIRGEDGASPAVEATIYRVLQEALFNVLRHARASKTEVRLHRVRDSFTLIIADDGVGLHHSHPDEGIRVDARGVGLSGMRALIDQCKGRLIVRERKSGSGTLIAARIDNVTALF